MGIRSDKLLNFEDPSRESVFFRPQSWCLSYATQKNLQKEIDKIMEHTASLNDDRLLVLVGSLLIENVIDDFLEAIIPDYKSLRKKGGFTFSERIELARSLKLCPSRLFTCADKIRDIRNKFVHNLSIDAFSKLPSGHLQSIRDHLSKFDSQFDLGQKDAVVFERLVTYLTMGLWIYTKHVLWLNEFIHSNELLTALKKYCRERPNRS